MSSYKAKHNRAYQRQLRAGTPLGIGRSSVLQVSRYVRVYLGRFGLLNIRVLQLVRAGISAVYVTDIQDVHFEGLQKEVAQASGLCKLHTHILDASDEPGTKALCQKVISEQGRLDIFVANAGFVDMNNLWATDLHDFVSGCLTGSFGDIS